MHSYNWSCTLLFVGFHFYFCNSFFCDLIRSLLSHLSLHTDCLTPPTHSLPDSHPQCIELKRRLQQLISEKLPKYGDPLFVVSPLTRSLQTFMESNPFPERLVDGNAGVCFERVCAVCVCLLVLFFGVTPYALFGLRTGMRDCQLLSLPLSS